MTEHLERENSYFKLATWRQNAVYSYPFVGILLALILTIFGRPSPQQQARKLLVSNPTRKEIPLRIFSTVLIKLKDDYIDPDLIKPMDLFTGAIEALEKEFPEIIFEKTESEYRIRIKDKRFSIKIINLSSLLSLYEKMNEVFSILESKLNNINLRDAEYRAINGMLSVLDNHSSLLTPEMYSEIKAGTRGSFTGIGIVVTLRDGYITVISSIDDTPAARAGIKPGDKIVRIGNVSTVNVTLNEAMKLLRGGEDSKTVLFIERKNAEKILRIELERSVIHLNSVSTNILPGNIGYIRIKQFTQTTETELSKALKSFNSKKINGLVLDLYNNPGGLLKQATSCANLFLDKGVIYSTVSRKNNISESKSADADDTLFKGPMVVLINEGSASASEILAGALKHHKRALLVGKTSFGKGSIQVVSENNDGSALKMTIAHYLSAGKYAIHNTGVKPHIKIGMIKSNQKNFLVSPFMVKSLIPITETLPGAGIKDKSGFFTLNFLDSSPDDDPWDVSTNNAPSPVINIASEIIKNFSNPLSTESEALNVWLKKKKLLELTKLMTILGKNGINWTKPENTTDSSALELSVKYDNHFVRAGESLSARVEVRNLGTSPAYRVFTMVKTEPEIQRREVVFGKIDPGESIIKTVHFRVDKSLPAMLWNIEYKLFSGGDSIGFPVLKTVRESRMEIIPARPPIFRMHYHFMDDSGGNGDGLIQPGENIRIRLMVVNDGPGDSGETSIKLVNETPLNMEILKGRVNFPRLLSGETRNHDFVISISKEAAGTRGKMKLVLKDKKFGIVVPAEMILNIMNPGPAPINSQGLITFPSDTVLRDGPGKFSNIIGVAKKSSIFRISGTQGSWIKLILHPERTAFAPVSEGKLMDSWQLSLPSPRWIPWFQIQAPWIKIKKMPILTDKTSVPIVVEITHPVAIIDASIERFNGKNYQKILYVQGNGKNRISINESLQVGEGFNKIRIHARANPSVNASVYQYIFYKP
ncbi:S41 family peptidase [Myxococcota bacterium]|nr:S41 family peptidase [Myxococcota bacterium]MBU1380857.1 S41 family peptidase [Myxococcota bacterium]MBU1499154.1 S41 family peptidase [Myxococcota bacterium]